MQKGIMNMIDEKILLDFQNLSQAACYNAARNEEFIQTNDTKFCDVIFDGLLCWAAIPAGSFAIQPCPNELVKSKNQVSLHIDFCIQAHF